MESSDSGKNNYFVIINQRKWSFFVPCIAVIISSIAICLYLPSIYKSTSQILVKGPEVSSDYVKQSVTGYVEERVGSIKTHILNSERLEGMIEQYKLYPDLQKEESIDDIVSLIRDNTTILTEEADFLKDAGEIVFALSYEDKDPQTAQQINKLLTEMFLEQNVNIRKQEASETTLFLENEMKNFEKQLQTIEGQITTFKQQHINELPSLLQSNIARLQDVKLKREDVKEKILEQKGIEQDLRIRLATIPEDNKELRKREKLVDLETLLANLRSQYSEEYPDVIRVKAELVELKKKTDEKFGEDETGKNFLGNPAHVTLSAQLSTVTNEINSLKRQLEELDRKENEYQKRIETTLRIEDDYTYLVNKRENNQKKYDELMTKAMDAKVSSGLEEEQKGERFTLIEKADADYPLKPYKPNRLAIILLGCFLGVGLGTGVVGIQEYQDHSIRDGDMLENLFSMPVLGCIPVIFSEEKKSRMGKIWLMVVTIVVTVSIGIFFALTYFNSFNAIESINQFSKKIIDIF